jgi:lipoate-protein ligase A
MQTNSSWRIIDTGPLPGPANMAVDEALLTAFTASDSASPVLRLYGWEPPALSLGRYQRAAEVLDLPRCADAQVPIVRRITGGGVIWHADELTYSIVCAPRHLPAGLSVKESFRALTSFLIRFYELLGIPAAWARYADGGSETLGERTAFCFAGRESYDILIDGRKIGGNAQRRLKNTVFQHGSIPLHNRVAEGVGFMREKPAGIGAATTSLGDEGIVTSRDDLAALLARAFREAMGVEAVVDRLTGDEQRLADRLEQEKYRDERWNLDGIAGK